MTSSEVFLESLRSSWNAVIHGKGGHCPCCDRWGKIYGRPLNETVVKSLVWLCSKELVDGWVDVPNRAPRFVIRSNQPPTLGWWNLVERRDTTRTKDVKHNGLWRPTDLGRSFALGSVKVPEKVFTYNNNVVALSDEEVYIKDCFGTFFEYSKTLSDYPPGYGLGGPV